MKFLKILKEYNQAIIKENQKLKSIYETLLKESDGEDVELDNECDVFEAETDNDEAGEDEGSEKTNEADEMMSAEEFFKEAEGEDADDVKDKKNVDEGVKMGAVGAAAGAALGGPVGAALGGAIGAAYEDDAEDAEGKDDVSETDEMMSAEEFFKESETDDAEEEKKANDDIGEADDADYDDEEEKKANDDIGEADEMMSAEEFFKEADEAMAEDAKKNDTTECDVSEEEGGQKMSAEEFFDINEDDSTDVEDEDEDSEKTNEADEMMTAEEDQENAKSSKEKIDEE